MPGFSVGAENGGGGMACSNQYLLSLLQCGFAKKCLYRGLAKVVRMMDCRPNPKILNEVIDDLHRARLLVYTDNMDHGVRIDNQTMLLRKN
jgi:hypothetical protein